MILSDLASLLIGFGYVAALIALSEILRRMFHVPVEITRKIVHVGVGMAAIALKVIFREWHIAIIGPIVFLLVNYVSHRANLFQGLETGEHGQLGTIYFPLSFVILTPLLWSQPEVLAASMMPLTWGDTAAAILGARYGMHKFTIFDQTSSVEGAIAMFVFSFIGTYFALVLFGQSTTVSLILASTAAFIATIFEALSPGGIDNLTVPLVSALVLVILNQVVK
jgi:phytol kinase